MLSIRTATKFRKSLKKLLKSGSFESKKLEEVVDLLSCEEKLDKNHKDHSLTGDMSDYRECHLEFDLLLIYKTEDDCLVLVNIGTHSDLFG
ncbi:MAG: type II toxin-antitoxin system YafQ family toxin [Minisyncoccia bacterium]